ncbi:MAG: PQQ-binding-like beta-propeller repeat protein, partial [Chitinivibrionales bacterium]|nr:PQQ-binding-like beta-propeller repeat protein [Chitinivibrionales bacterium]
MNRNPRMSSRITIIMLAFILALLVGAGLGKSNDAAELLEAYGRSAGLAALLSTAEQPPAELALALANAGFGVHAIVATESARAKLLESVGAQPGSDLVSAECLSLSSLPYLDNFVNLLIIDDPKLSRAHGLAKGEMERVVTPGGIIAVRTRGGWDISRKAWPQGMDNWTHPNYDASGNRCSNDSLVKPPFGYKWIDGPGTPVTRGLGSKGWVVSDGRLFVVTGNVVENHGLVAEAPEEPEQYLVARDAFNGLLLWKQRLGAPVTRGLWSLIEGHALIKVTPVAVDSAAVYAVRDGKLTAFGLSDGKVLYTCDNEYRPWAIRQAGGSLVSAGFGRGDDSAAGGVEVFDVSTGKRRWTLAVPPNNVIASPAAVFVQVKGATPADDCIIGCDLTDGRELFRLSGKQCDGATPRLLSCGDDYLLVNARYATMCVSPADGAVKWQLDSVPYFWGPVIDNQLWVDGGAYDMSTGKKVQTMPRLLLGEGMTANEDGSRFGCVAMGMVGNMTLSGRHHRYQIVQDDTLGLYFYRGMRAGCGPSLVAANGMLFAAPVNCICTPTHPYGFTTLAPVGSDPSSEEFTRAKPVERGPSYGTLDSSVACSAWPTYRANAARSSSSELPSVYSFAPSWETKVLTRHSNGLLGHSLASRTLASLSPPVAGCGKVFVAVTDRGEVVALDQKSGAEAWRFRAGSRVETSPTVFHNGVFFGCNDGYVYALSAADGSMMWRTRLAPRERRMLEHGIVESTWPVYGAVLQYRGILFASAGRNSESDGGAVIVALDPATGTRRWSRHLDVVMIRKNDVLRVADGRIVWHNIDLCPLTGDGNLLEGRVKMVGGNPAYSGMWDNTHVYMPGSRRTGTVFTQDDVSGWLMAWNDSYIVDPHGKVRVRGAPKKEDGGESGGRRRGPVFDVTTQPTAVVACAKAAIAGYGAPSGAKGRLTVCTADGTETASIPLSAGVQHNGIAVTPQGVVVALENGRIAFFENVNQRSAKADYVQRVNCGGNEYTDSKKMVWSADREYEPGAFGRVGGGGYDRTPDLEWLAEGFDENGMLRRGMRKNVSGPDPYLYMTELSNMSAYRFTVPNGRYEVTLHFAETYYFDTMLLPNGDLSWVHRRFNVKLNGAPVLENWEPAAENDGVTHVPIVKKFRTNVADGDITI